MGVVCLYDDGNNLVKRLWGPWLGRREWDLRDNWDGPE